jgi:lysyl-tRNA synthetase class 2
MTRPEEPAGLELRRHPDAATLVPLRARLLAALRAWLDARGFVEADVPVLLPHAGQESHLHAPALALPGLPGRLWLQTSPELCLKRLVCAGVPRVYALGPAFRAGREELSTLHQPQFSMLEWYRPGDSLDALVADVQGLAAAAAEALDVAPPPAGRVLALREAFTEFVGCPLDPLLDGDAPAFAAAAQAAGIEGCRADDAPATLFGRALVARLEPALAALPGLVFLRDWPACGAALARLGDGDPRVAQRVEAYLGGIELANGYVELRDAEQHRRRWQREAAAREDAAPPWDEGLLADLAAPGLPPTVGMALGVDRLLLALRGGTALAEVLPFHLAAPTDGPRP